MQSFLRGRYIICNKYKHKVYYLKSKEELI